MKCSHCGAENPDNLIACSRCGAPMPQGVEFRQPNTGRKKLLALGR